MIELIPYAIYKLFGAIFNFLSVTLSNDILVMVLLYHFISKD